MPTTSPDNIYYADTATTSNDVNVSATEASSVQAAFNVRQIRSYKVANAAALTALTGMTEGDIADRADIDATYRYNGTSWRVTSAGTIPVVPTSVSGTGVSFSINGKVSFTAATSITINGIFTSEYENYCVIYNADQSLAAGLTMRLSLAGVAAAGTQYDHQQTYSTGTTAAGFQSINVNTFNLQSGGGQGQSGKFDIFNPAVAVNTRLKSLFITHNSGTGVMYDGTVGGVHKLNVAYDGIVILPTNGTLTGSLRVYGYNNN